MTFRRHSVTVCSYVLFLGSGPGRGRSPVEWGENPSVRSFVRPPPAQCGHKAEKGGQPIHLFDRSRPRLSARTASLQNLMLDMHWQSAYVIFVSATLLQVITGESFGRWITKGQKKYEEQNSLKNRKKSYLRLYPPVSSGFELKASYHEKKIPRKK